MGYHVVVGRHDGYYPLCYMPKSTLWYDECFLVEDDLLPALDPNPGQLLEDVKWRKGPAINDNNEFKLRDPP